MAYTVENYLQKIDTNTGSNYTSIGYEKITVGNSISKLTIPTGANYAQLVLETDTTGVVARFLRNSSQAVTSSNGVPLTGTGASLDIANFTNLAGFQIILAQASTTYLHVEYFKQ